MYIYREPPLVYFSPYFYLIGKVAFEFSYSTYLRVNVYLVHTCGSEGGCSIVLPLQCAFVF